MPLQLAARKHPPGLPPKAAPHPLPQATNVDACLPRRSTTCVCIRLLLSRASSPLALLFRPQATPRRCCRAPTRRSLPKHIARACQSISCCGRPIKPPRPTCLVPTAGYTTALLQGANTAITEKTAAQFAAWQVAVGGEGLRRLVGRTGGGAPTE